MNTSKIVSLLSSLTFSAGTPEDIKNVYSAYTALKAPSEQLCFVIKSSDGVLLAGTYGSLIGKNTLHVESVLTKQEYKRKGLASALLKKLEIEAFSQGAYFADMTTFEEVAASFALKNSYKVVAEMINAPIKESKMTYLQKPLTENAYDLALPDGLTVELGSSEDIQTIGGLHWQHHFASNKRFAEETPHKTLSLLAKDEAGNFVGGIVGNINLSDTLFIHCVLVNKSFRRQGLGTDLLQRLEALAKKEGAYLSFAKDGLPAAEPFFKSNGYQVIGSIDNSPTMNNKMCYFKKDL